MISELLTFNGGLSTKTSSHLIAKNEGIICENVDLESGTLKPFSSLEFISTINGEHITFFNDTLISSLSISDDRFYDTFSGRLYWSDKGYTTSGLRRYNGTNAGVSADAPNGISNIALINLSECSIADNSGQMTQGVDYLYAFTLVNSDGIESAPVYHPTTINLANKNKLSVKIAILKTNISTVIPSGYTMNVYRVGGSNPTFNLIAEGLNSTTMQDGDVMSACGAGNYCYRDKLADIDVSRIELYTSENTPANSNMDMLINNQGTFFGAIGTKVYFSRSGSAEFWSTLDFVVLDKTVTGLGKFADTIIAFTKTSAYQILGYSRDTIQVNRLPFNQGCVNKHSVVNIDAYLIWTSMNGVCLYNGSEIQVITKKTIAWDEFGRLGNTTYDDYNSTTSKWGSGLGFDIKYAVGYQDKYYGLYNDGVMIIDLANGLKVSTISTPNAVSLGINKDDNILYVVVDNLDTTYDVYALLKSNSKMTGTWKTGRITEGSTDVKKHYRQVQLDGIPISVEIFINGISKYISYGKDKFMLPSGLIGLDIQFEIKTVNEIRSMKYQYSVLSA